jgi:hypothetical protein
MMKKCIPFLALSILIGFMFTGKAQSQTWEPDTRLTFNDSLSYFSYPTQWAIAADPSDRVHIVWYDLRDPQFASEVYYKRSLDNGGTWGADTRLTTGSSYWQETPCIVADNSGRLHVVYSEFVISGGFSPDIHYKRSLNGGSSWQAQTTIASVYGDFSGHTSLASDLGNGVFVLYCHQTGSSFNQIDNFFVGSTNGGLTWGSPYQLTNSKTALWGSIAADTLGKVHIVYVEAPSGQRQLFYRRSLDQGQTFQPPVQLTTASSNKFNGSIYTDRGNRVHVVWQDNRDGNYEIYYLRSEDGGSTWEAEVRLTNDSHSSVEPNLMADQNNGVYLVWTDEQTDQGVYFKSSEDGGQTWSTDTCLTNGAVPQYDQFFPNIACNDSGTYLHIAWKDMRDGNLEVYYKRRTPSQSVDEDVASSPNFLSFDVLPNPFSDRMRIIISGEPEHRCIGEPEIKIFDLSGRVVRQISLLPFDFSLGAQATWDGTDDNGKKVMPELYFIQVKSDGYTETRKVIKLQ